MCNEQKQLEKEEQKKKVKDFLAISEVRDAIKLKLRAQKKVKAAKDLETTAMSTIQYWMEILQLNSAPVKRIGTFALVEDSLQDKFDLAKFFEKLLALSVSVDVIKEAQKFATAPAPKKGYIKFMPIKQKDTQSEE